MWNEGENLVELVRAGEGALVSGFGGEGEGLKCMKEFNWVEENPVLFRVQAEQKVIQGCIYCILHNSVVHILYNI